VLFENAFAQPDDTFEPYPFTRHASSTLMSEPDDSFSTGALASVEV
jgi:hypothetical protein